MFYTDDAAILRRDCEDSTKSSTTEAIYQVSPLERPLIGFTAYTRFKH